VEAQIITEARARDILSFGDKFTLEDYFIEVGRLVKEGGVNQREIRQGYWIIRVDKTGKKE